MALENSSARQRVELSLLPTELIHTICSHIGPSSPPLDQSSKTIICEMNRNFATLCRCSKMLSVVVRPYLYRNVATTPMGFSRLLRSFLHRPGLGALVRYLRIDESYDSETSESRDILEAQGLAYFPGFSCDNAHDSLTRFDLVFHVLCQTSNLETLTMADEESIRCKLPPPELKKLRKLRLENIWVPDGFPIGACVSGLLQGAPILTALEMDGSFAMDGQAVVYQNITHLSLDFSYNLYADRPIFGFLEACVKLSDLTYIHPSLCSVYQELVDMFSCIFQPGRKPLLSLRLEPGDGPFCDKEETL